MAPPSDVREPLCSADANDGEVTPWHRMSVMQLKILNTVAFIVTLVFNGISSAGLISKYGIGTVSRLYPTKITPAGPAFSIWGIIYSLQGAFIVYQCCAWPAKDNAQFQHKLGIWFAATCLFNCLWIVVFVQGTVAAVWISSVFLFAMLACLLKLYLNCGLWTTPRHGWGDDNFAAHVVHMLLFDAQFSLYAGWVTVACIVNATVALTTTGWDGAPFSDSTWSVIMQAVALVVNLAIVVTRRDFVYPSVLCWATYWISQANTDDNVVYTGSLVVSISAGVAAVVTALFALVKWIRYMSRTVNMTSDDAARGCEYGSDNARNDQERVCDA